MVVETKHAGKTDREVAGQFHVDHRTVARIYKRWVAENTVEKISRSGRPHKITIHHESEGRFEAFGGGPQEG